MPATPRPFLVLAAAVLVVVSPLRAQRTLPDLAAEATAGSDAERYLRVLQVAGAAPLYPWSIRAFSPRELDRLVPDSAAGPWAARFAPAAAARGPRLEMLRPSLRAIYNTAYPQGMNDGPLWAGRGGTLSATAGFALRWGALSVRVEPQVFWAQ